MLPRRMRARPKLVLAHLAAALALAISCGGGDGAGPKAPSAVTPAASPTPSPVTRIMPLGDSITQANDETNSYRRPLWRLLQGSGRRVDFVGSQSENHQGPPPNPDFDLDHEGHWGWTADDVLREIDGWARAFTPDVVLLHLGSNDALRGHDTAETLDELAAIVARLRAANPRVSVLLAQLIPTRRAADNRRIEALNAGIPGLAARLDSAASRVVVVDQYTGFDANTDTRDGIHPNAAGEEKMASVWNHALAGVIR